MKQQACAPLSSDFSASFSFMRRAALDFFPFFCYNFFMTELFYAPRGGFRFARAWRLLRIRQRNLFAFRLRKAFVRRTRLFFAFAYAGIFLSRRFGKRSRRRRGISFAARRFFRDYFAAARKRTRARPCFARRIFKTLDGTGSRRKIPFRARVFRIRKNNA